MQSIINWLCQLLQFSVNYSLEINEGFLNVPDSLVRLGSDNYRPKLLAYNLIDIIK